MRKNIIRIAIVVGLILLVPLWANHNIEGWNWSPLDFVFMGALLFGTGLTYELVARVGGTVAYRAAVAIACIAGFLLVWINAAVGIIGDDDLDGPNAMFVGVLAIGLIGAFIARFQPRGMSRALLATALAHALVPVLALIFWTRTVMSEPPGVVGVFVLNGFFVALWGASALLFRQAADTRPKITEPQRGSRESGEGQSV
jgi:hypothetical protein